MEEIFYVYCLVCGKVFGNYSKDTTHTCLKGIYIYDLYTPTSVCVNRDFAYNICESDFIRKFISYITQNIN